MFLFPPFPQKFIDLLRRKCNNKFGMVGCTSNKPSVLSWSFGCNFIQQWCKMRISKRFTQSYLDGSFQITWRERKEWKYNRTYSTKDVCVFCSKPGKKMKLCTMKQQMMIRTNLRSMTLELNKFPFISSHNDCNICSCYQYWETSKRRK